MMKNLLTFFIFMLFASMPLRADIHSDLQNILTQSSTLNTELETFTFDQNDSCVQIKTLNRDIQSNTQNIQALTETISALSITDADLDAISDLSSLTLNMSMESIRLATELNTLTQNAELYQYRTALSAILQLSHDIGAMADRILEMSDRILIMADNIGLMADRILATQMIQNQNIASTQNALLITQQNMVFLSDSLSSITYNLTLGQIVNTSDLLLNDMNQTTLDNSHMQTQLASFQLETITLLDNMTVLLDHMVTNSAKMSHYINADTLTMLGDLSTIHRALSIVLENYAINIELIAPLTDTVILSDTTATMLQLTKDIGIMSDRIMQMSGQIFIMADNIGIMSDSIVATQNLQMSNVALTKASLLTSQSIMITVIKNFGL